MKVDRGTGSNAEVIETGNYRETKWYACLTCIRLNTSLHRHTHTHMYMHRKM